MEQRTRDALEASIEKWERLAADGGGFGAFLSWRECPLCEVFIHKSCRGCPVFQRSGLSGCKGTPYILAFLAYSSWLQNPDLEDAPDQFRAAAREEVEFLKSLRPTD